MLLKEQQEAAARRAEQAESGGGSGNGGEGEGLRPKAGDQRAAEAQRESRRAVSDPARGSEPRAAPRAPSAMVRPARAAGTGRHGRAGATQPGVVTSNPTTVAPRHRRTWATAATTTSWPGSSARPPWTKRIRPSVRSSGTSTGATRAPLDEERTDADNARSPGLPRRRPLDDRAVAAPSGARAGAASRRVPAAALRRPRIPRPATTPAGAAAEGGPATARSFRSGTPSATAWRGRPAHAVQAFPPQAPAPPAVPGLPRPPAPGEREREGREEIRRSSGSKPSRPLGRCRKNGCSTWGSRPSIPVSTATIARSWPVAAFRRSCGAPRRASFRSTSRRRWRERGTGGRCGWCPQRARASTSS